MRHSQKLPFFSRKRRLQREFLPQYGYDHSEAEVFDGYTTFPEGGGSVERLVYENARTKVRYEHLYISIGIFNNR